MEKGLSVDQKVLTKKHGIKTGIKYLIRKMIHQNLRSNSIYFSICDCKSEVLVIDYDYEIKIADIAIYENGLSCRNKMSWLEKFRYIYQILINNKPYADQMILNKNQLKDLKDFLVSILD